MDLENAPASSPSVLARHSLKFEWCHHSSPSFVHMGVLVEKPEGKNHLEDLGGRCQDNIKMDLQGVG